jgi:hypothetical protein
MVLLFFAAAAARLMFLFAAARCLSVAMETTSILAGIDVENRAQVTSDFAERIAAPPLALKSKQASPANYQAGLRPRLRLSCSSNEYFSQDRRPCPARRF